MTQCLFPKLKPRTAFDRGCRCPRCTSGKTERDRRYRKTYHEKFPARVKAIRRRSALKQRYGLTIEQIDAMGTTCMICGVPFIGDGQDNTKRGRHVDHSHKTHKVRGVLCQRCNLGLGLFNESITALEAAIQYLRKHSEDL